jgi:hypothetical protein
LKREATAKKQEKAARLKSAPKYENKNYDHFTPIKGQASAHKKARQQEFLVCNRKYSLTALEFRLKKLKPEFKFRGGAMIEDKRIF